MRDRLSIRLGVPMVAVAALLLAGVAPVAFAQGAAPEAYLELLRSDLRTSKVEILTDALNLSEQEAGAFWPIYREYSNELSKLGDRRMLGSEAGLRKVPEHGRGDRGEAGEGIIQHRRGQNKPFSRNTHKKVSKELGPVTAARFLQVESQVLTLIDAQIVDQVPLIKAATEKK